MSLTNLSFIGIYFPLLLIAYYNPFLKNNTFRKILLAGASLGLYSFSQLYYVLLLIAMILYNYFLVQLADKTNKNIFRTIAIILNVCILLGFKYINSILAFGASNNSITNIAFPVGLSYFTFKAISYVIDSKTLKEGNLLDVTIYISNFLTIVSGPLSTYKDEIMSIKYKQTGSKQNFMYKGLERFIIGLAKKIIIADSLSSLVLQCFSATDLSLLMAWSGGIAYTLQLFFDFSGYTDIVIGIGYLLGFNFPENFKYPYMATSISDFWKRWHITLTKWFTQYIYIPLGGSRVKTTSRHIFNLFVVWLVTGIWHGSSFTFLIWAMIYFVLQLIEKYTNWCNILKSFHLGHIYTLLIVILEWVIFKSSSISSMTFYIKSMFCLNGNALISSLDISTIVRYQIPFILGILFSTNIGEKIKKISSNQAILNGIYNICLIILFIICFLITLGRGYSAPLYAGF